MKKNLLIILVLFSTFIFAQNEQKNIYDFELFVRGTSLQQSNPTYVYVIRDFIMGRAQSQYAIGFQSVKPYGIKKDKDGNTVKFSTLTSLFEYLHFHGYDLVSAYSTTKSQFEFIFMKSKTINGSSSKVVE